MPLSPRRHVQLAVMLQIGAIWCSTRAFAVTAFCAPSGSKSLRLNTRLVPTITIRTLTLKDVDQEGVESIASGSFTTPNRTSIEAPLPSPPSRALLNLQSQMGTTIPEDRFLFPEYTSGNVSRLFSTLQYTNTTTLTATHASGSVPAAVALVTGTTVGAGVLALPTATYAAGLVPGTAALLLGYIVMTISGLLLAELVLNRFQTGQPDTTGILSLYTSNTSSVASSLSTVAYFFLHYALMVAYIAQGGLILSETVLSTGNSNMGSVVFGGAMATLLFVTNKTTMQTINNALVVGVFATFAATVGYGAPSADWSAALDPARQRWDQVPPAFPVIFLAFVYQNIVPVIVKDLEGDRNKIAQAIVGGTSIPLGMFVAWNAVILAHVGADTGDSVNPVSLLSGGENGPLLTTFVSSFSILAIITSLIGFVYGLLDAWTDVWALSPKLQVQWKVPLFALIFVPPLAIALRQPDVFQSALEYGGAFGVSTLFMIVPPWLVWQERYGRGGSLVTPPLVPGGKAPLVLLWVAAAMVILVQANEMWPQIGLVSLAPS